VCCAGGGDDAKAAPSKRQRTAGSKQGGNTASASGLDALDWGDGQLRAPEEEGEEDEQHILWRVNAEEMNRRLRHKACADHITKRHGRWVGGEAVGRWLRHRTCADHITKRHGR